MNFWEFLLALSFWQWIGFLLWTMLAAVAISSLGPFIVSRKHVEKGKGP